MNAGVVSFRQELSDASRICRQESRDLEMSLPGRRRGNDQGRGWTIGLRQDMDVVLVRFERVVDAAGGRVAPLLQALQVSLEPVGQELYCRYSHNHNTV